LLEETVQDDYNMEDLLREMSYDEGGAGMDEGNNTTTAEE